jgi:nucleotide-binding universal stress UspA family protein
VDALLTRESIWDELGLPPIIAPASRPRRILLAIDDSAESRRAAERAAELAGSHGEVTAFHVRRIDPVKWGPYTLETELDALQLVQNTVICLRELGARSRGLLAVARWDRIGREIATQAQRLDVDLIVMGTRNLSSIAQVLCGSVSRETLRRTTRPVTLVR